MLNKKDKEELEIGHVPTEDSNAVDTNVGTPVESIIKTEEEKLPMQYDTSVDCSILDVSDPNYCQPNSERHKAYLKAK